MLSLSQGRFFGPESVFTGGTGIFQIDKGGRDCRERDKPMMLVGFTRSKWVEFFFKEGTRVREDQK